MGPKKGNDENFNWRRAIEENVVNEESWKVKVVIIESAGSDQDHIYLNKFETCAAEERRFVIKNICKTETIFMVNQLSGEKKMKDDNSYIVFEVAQSFLKDKKDIPPDILALIIKHLILKLKDEYLFIQRQRLAVKEGIRRESITMINKTEVRGTVVDKSQEPVPPVSPLPKGKKKKDSGAIEIPQNLEDKKYNTLLRVRGEEWRDKVYVDDFPEDGPNLYVAITGFMEPYLAGCLIDIGIPITAIVQVRIDSTKTKIPLDLHRVSKRRQSQTDTFGDKILEFWEESQRLRIAEHFEILNNTAFIIFSPPYWDVNNLSGNPEQIYDEVCYLLYDVQDLTRQHDHYLENMDIVDIPEEPNDCSIEIFDQLIADVPLESTTIYSILDNMIVTVLSKLQPESQTSRSSLSIANTLIHPQEKNKIKEAQSFVSEVFNNLCQTEKQKSKYRVTYGEEYENHKEPVIIDYGNICKYKTFHLGNINLDNIVRNSLYAMPVNKLWSHYKRASGDLEVKINFHINVLMSCFNRTDLETSELTRLMHILACRKIYNNRSSLKKQPLLQSTIAEFKKKFLKRSILAEPLPRSPSLDRSFSINSKTFANISPSVEVSNATVNYDDEETDRIKFLFDFPDISELVSAAEIANQRPINHFIDEFEFYEDFSGIQAFQLMLEASNKFNCVDYKYCEVTDSIIMMFFNSHDSDGISRNEWRSHVATPVCLQDFFDFILEERYDWIQSEERKYDQDHAIRSQSLFKDFKDSFAINTCVQNTNVEMELLMEGSLKHQVVTEMEEESPETSEAKVLTSKNSTSPTSTSYVDSKSSKKTKSPKSSSPKPKRSFAFVDQDLETENIPKKTFIGYSLGDRRVEVFGRDSVYFSKDGSRVSAFYTLSIPTNFENVILNFVPGYTTNSFWIHKVLGEKIQPEVVDTCESFRISTKDQVIIYVKKQNYKVITPTKDDTAKSRSFSPSVLSQSTDEIINFHSFSITWPNGLVTESVYENNSAVISHIKQFNTIPSANLDEDMRCISLNGEVIVFKTNGNIEVLRPDASYLKITKYGKRMYTKHAPEDINSEASSEKNKKNKGKEKGKEKSSKASSRTSNNVLNADEIKSIEYELFIEEFESIETSGLRQKWIEDDCYDIEKLFIRTATDYGLGEIFSRRMDGTSTLLNKDGLQIVTFPNNTRIITAFIIEEDEIFPEWTEEELEYFDLYDSERLESNTGKSKRSLSSKSGIDFDNYNSTVSNTLSKKFEEEISQTVRLDGYVSVQLIFTIEHCNFTTVTINKAKGNISVESPNNTLLSVNMDNHYEFKLDDLTNANFDGNQLNINYHACTKCKANTKCTINIVSDEVGNNLPKTWLQMRDSYHKNVIVNEEGNISVTEGSDEVMNVEDLTDAKEETIDSDKIFTKSENNSGKISEKCTKFNEAKSLQFFILKRDLNCSELVHRVLIEEYKKECRWQPWCSIKQYDTFGDHRRLLSILTPVHLTEAEKWLMNSKLANKPQHLTFKDLKPDPGKGFYHWMRPYERFEPQPRKPDPVLPHRLPRAYILRTLEQQWTDEKREELNGAKELLSAILRYRNVIESNCQTVLHVPLIDFRSEEERRIDEVIQAVGHRVYEDLKMRLAEDVQSRARPDITTKPLPTAQEESVGGELEGELEEETVDYVGVIEEERASLVKEVEEAEKMSPALKRYWRRREEEQKEEQFYRYLLREGSVPPYFRNMLGGAIWWEMNNVAGEAATLVDRRKMRCDCVGEDSSCSGDTATLLRPKKNCKP